MWKNPFTYLAAVVLLSVASFFAAGTYELLHVGYEISAATASTNTLLTKANAEVDRVDTTRKTLDDLMVQTTTLITDADDTATKESGYLDDWNKQLSYTLTNVNSTVLDLDTNQNRITTHAIATLDATTTTVAGVQPVLANAATATATANKTVADLDKFLTAPVLAATIGDVQKMTATGAQMLDTANQVETKATSSYLHPKPESPIKKAWHATEPWLLVTAKILAAAS